MNPAAIGLAIIFLVLGAMLGWFAQKTQAAHGDVKVAKTRLAGGRKTRWRSGVFAVAVVVALLFAIIDAMQHPR
jgi:ABC-type Fe3+ transport system permease subunit